MNRRGFIKSMVAMAPAAVLLSRAGTKAFAGSADASRISAVVYDERYSDCRIFAEALASRGAKAFRASADCAGLWYGDLSKHLAERGGRVAGLTTYADFGVSEASGRAAGLKLVYVGSHDGRANGELLHRTGTVAGGGSFGAGLAGHDANWPAALAAGLDSAAQGNRAVKFEALLDVEPVASPRSADHPGYLISWVLGPFARTARDTA